MIRKAISAKKEGPRFRPECPFVYPLGTGPFGMNDLSANFSKSDSIHFP